MNVQSRNCCWSNKCSKPSTRYTKRCEQRRHNRSQRKKQHSIPWSARKLNGAHHGARPLVEIQILHFLLLFFWYFFLIMYDVNRKHTNFQLNWAEGVACRNSTICSTKFKAPSRVRVRCLRSRIWASFRGQTRLGWGLIGCALWFYPI
jgi:hypothetical protein